MKNHKEDPSSRQVLLDYHVLPFLLLHKELYRKHQFTDAPHPIRKRFWQLVPGRQYEIFEARALLESYLFVVERELKSILGRWSLGYWLHAYRRLSPGPIGGDTSPGTIGLTRAAMEAAIQKYGMDAACQRVGTSPGVPLDRVLKGILLSPDFEYERMLITQEKPQLVLTDFGPSELLELYDVEKLAFEIWRATATLRSIGKGAPFVVEGAPHFFRDDRSDDLDWLLQHHDERIGGDPGTSSAAVVYENYMTSPHTGIIFLPVYNVLGIPGEHLAPLFRHLSKGRLNIDSKMKFNFLWYPFSIRGYRDAHTPFDDAFEHLHDVSLDAVLLVIASLCWRMLYSWIETEGYTLLRYYQRAYEGPYKRDYVRSEARAFRRLGAELLGISADAISDDEFEKALCFWTLTPGKRDGIDLPYSGPHEILLPFGKDRLFIDYAWIGRRLYDLFVGVSISDQNFKGDALERLIRQKPSLLPKGKCKARDGTSKQVDADYVIGEHLVLVECKAVSRSIGFDRGDPKAINYRHKHVVERLLREADSKADWLAKRPLGTNYSLQGIRDILPVGVSPFVEFIPSRELRYWVTGDTPRVLTPAELNKMLASPETIERSFNRVSIVRR